MDAIDRELIRLTQRGLPLTPMPYHELAGRLAIPPQEVMARLEAMLDEGIIRRIGAVPNHYALGYRLNGMSVWDVEDEAISELGRQVGALPFVSHCYHRPRRLPLWPYNLFAMVHGKGRNEVEEKVKVIAGLLGERCRGFEVLYSTRILKKTGLRLKEGYRRNE